MVRKRRIGLSDVARQEVIATIRSCRRATVRVLTEYPIGGPEYQAALQVMPVLSELMRQLDGGANPRDGLPRIPLT